VGHLVVQLAAARRQRDSSLARPVHGRQVVDHGAERVVTGDDDLEQAAFDVVLDGVGGASLERAIRAIRPRARFVLYGATEPEPAKLTLLDFIGHEGAGFSPTSPIPLETRRASAPISPRSPSLVARGQLRPTVGTVFDWREAAGAHALARQVPGKTVLTIAERPRQRPDVAAGPS